ncbi:MAG: DUF1254 domain-containing protein [Planctomycetaceae bacterium]
MITSLHQLRKAAFYAFCLILSVVTTGPLRADDSIKVNIENFARVETAFQFDRFHAIAGGVNKWFHNRVPTPLDKQNVIRMNRDTLYSFALVDISEGATLTMPDAGDRYMSVMVVNEDQYINNIYHGAGTYKLTVDEFDTPYVLLACRTLADPTNSDDLHHANKLQDELQVNAKSAKSYHHPNYDQTSYEATYKPLLALATGLTDSKFMFGKREEVSPVRYIIGAASGWGGLPTYEAMYQDQNKPKPAGEYR